MEQELIITLILLLFINISGCIYSYLIVSNRIFKDKKIQVQERTDVAYLKKHFGLFSFNVIILIFFVFIGFIFFKDYIINDNKISFAIMLTQLAVILIFDDTFFYFLHRIMHENKFIYKTVHKIHHRANAPIPIDYIYVHPFEWMSGFIGPFIGILLMGGVSIYTFWLYLFVRNFHELAIHSGIKTSKVLNIIPLLANNEHHDIHHEKRDGNYSSTFYLWDILLRTKIK